MRAGISERVKALARFSHLVRSCSTALCFSHAAPAIAIDPRGAKIASAEFCGRHILGVIGKYLLAHDALG